MVKENTINKHCITNFPLDAQKSTTFCALIYDKKERKNIDRFLHKKNR
jgi:hypothetical protein